MGDNGKKHYKLTHQHAPPSPGGWNIPAFDKFVMDIWKQMKIKKANAIKTRADKEAERYSKKIKKRREQMAKEVKSPRKFKTPEEKKVRQKRYYERNREKIRAYQQKWRVEHPEKIEQYRETDRENKIRDKQRRLERIMKRREEEKSN